MTALLASKARTSTFKGLIPRPSKSVRASWLFFKPSKAQYNLYYTGRKTADYANHPKEWVNCECTCEDLPLRSIWYDRAGTNAAGFG